MITVENLSMQFSGSVLFSKVDLQFTAGNCYGIIGANGAGKSTFVKILSGELEASSGHVYIDPKARMSVLKQDQFMYDEYTVMDTDNFGLVTQIEVGAMFVGRIVNYPATAEFKRGQEKGYFEFGGSTVILLFRPGTVSIDKNIAENSLRGIETPVEIGQRIGTALRTTK